MEAGRMSIADLEPDNTVVDERYGLRWKDALKAYKHGYSFRMGLADATGEVAAIYWGDDDEAKVRSICDSLRIGATIKVVGTTSSWRGRLMLNINPAKGGVVEMADGDDYEMDSLVPHTDKDVEEMYSVLMGYIREIGNDHLRMLLSTMLGEERMSEMLKRSPASVSYHCGWIGGLLEHTLNVVRICDAISCMYIGLDRDLLLAGAMLHDIGKVRCYEVNSAISESAEGRLLGHIAIGSAMVGEACSTIPDFPPSLQMKLIHMVLASHGEMEKGSPVTPSMPEAVALNHADDLDAKVERFLRAREGGSDRDVFTYDSLLRTKVFML